MTKITHVSISEIGEIPKEGLKILKNAHKGEKILSIFSKKSEAIYFFPVRDAVTFIQMDIFPLNPEVSAKITNAISNFSSKILFSTGLEIEEGKCVWEGYFDSSFIDCSNMKVEKYLKTISEATNISISTIEV